METSARPGSARGLILGAALGLGASILGVGASLLAGLPGGMAALVVSALAGGLLLSSFGPAFLAGGKKPAEGPAAKPAELAQKEIPEDRIDALTGLANANGLAAWFVEKRGRLEEDGRAIVVLVANLDAFEEVSRLRGKQTSDIIIIEVAKRVSAFVGDDGIAARSAGDEFVAIATVVPERAAEWAEEKAGKMAEVIGRPVEIGMSAIWIGGSVGAAVGRPPEGDAILARAREAFLKARRLGLGRYVVDRGGSPTSS